MHFFMLLRIDDVDRHTSEECLDVLHGRIHNALAALFRRPGDVRRDDAVLRFQQRVIHADRLGVDHVQSRRSDFTSIERIGNILLVDELTACVIDENDAILHLGDAVLIDHAGVFRCEIAVQCDDIRTGVKLVQRYIFRDRAAGVIQMSGNK